MAKQTIFLGTTAGDGTGTPLRESLDICNDNFDELYGATGWAVYNDTTYTTGSPFLVTSGIPSQSLPNDALSKIETQLPTDVTTFYDGNTITGRNGDALLITIEFRCRPTTAASNVRIKTSIDIGGAIGEIYPRESSLTKGSGVEHFYLSTTNAYTLDTWEANGGIVKIEAFNSNVEVYSIRYVISRVHKAR